MHQKRQGRSTWINMDINNAGFEITPKICLYKWCMRKEMHSACLSDLRDTHDVFWWIKLNVNWNFVSEKTQDNRWNNQRHFILLLETDLVGCKLPQTSLFLLNSHTIRNCHDWLPQYWINFLCQIPLTIVILCSTEEFRVAKGYFYTFTFLCKNKT